LLRPALFPVDDLALAVDGERLERDFLVHHDSVPGRLEVRRCGAPWSAPNDLTTVGT
jgi:hypothetical protein